MTGTLLTLTPPTCVTRHEQVRTYAEMDGDLLSVHRDPSGQLTLFVDLRQEELPEPDLDRLTYAEAYVQINEEDLELLDQHFSGAPGTRSPQAEIQLRSALEARRQIYVLHNVMSGHRSGPPQFASHVRTGHLGRIAEYLGLSPRPGPEPLSWALPLRLSGAGAQP